ncbi:cytochrome c biogenesis protein CcdA, partial [Campylobacter concisus]|uniref:cytochrome c biogenesis protein CcdA n=1 Tax=Campylobacter concisus TaxID=199 RepID=UPI0015E19A32
PGARHNIFAGGGFAAVFDVLGLGMVGVGDINLPSKFKNFISINSQNSSGLIGVFNLGFASALIVSPCVAAPLAGALLYIAQSGDAIYGGIMLFDMGLGMGAPLLVVGLSSGKLLPRHGGWMDEVRKLFGFLKPIIAVWTLASVRGAFLDLLG